MSEPWNFTEAQRRQFREAHAAAKEADMARTAGTPDLSGWPLGRLTAQRKHLESLLAVSAGQADPLRPRLRAEHEAVCAEIAGRELKAQREHKCPRCHIPKLNRCRAEDGTLLDHPHAERVKLVRDTGREAE